MNEEFTYCVNGCNKPVHEPRSKVLCKDCFEKLDNKFKELAKSLGMYDE